MYAFEKKRMTLQQDIKQFPLNVIGQVAPVAMGWGAHKTVGDQVVNAGMKHALLCTTGLRGTGIIEEIESIVNNAGVATTIYKNIHSNPRIEDVEDGVIAFQEAGCDGILSVGGGSSHDTGKMIRMRLENPDKTVLGMACKLDPHFLEVIADIKPPSVEQVTVNTTAGTGAEMTPFAVVTDWEKHYKFPLLCAGLNPVFGINDPLLMRTMPMHMAAQTGIDCLIHAFGGCLSRLNNQISWATGIHGTRLVAENLPEFVNNRWNEKTCEAMTWAQYLGATTYGLGGGVGMIHATAHQVSAINDIHHGLANAIMMVPATTLNIPAAPEKMKTIVEYAFGVDTRNMSRFQAAEAFVGKLEELRNRVGITDIKLSNYGITEADCEHMCRNSVNDLNMEGNARDMTEEDVLALYKSML